MKELQRILEMGATCEPLGIVRFRTLDIVVVEWGPLSPLRRQPRRLSRVIYRELRMFDEVL